MDSRVMDSRSRRRRRRGRIPDWQYRAAAHRIHHYEGIVEMDDGATVSRWNDKGAYIEAWIWVPREHLTAEDKTDGARERFR